MRIKDAYVKLHTLLNPALARYKYSSSTELTHGALLSLTGGCLGPRGSADTVLHKKRLLPQTEL